MTEQSHRKKQLFKEGDYSKLRLQRERNYLVLLIGNICKKRGEEKKGKRDKKRIGGCIWTGGEERKQFEGSKCVQQ